MSLGNVPADFSNSNDLTNSQAKVYSLFILKIMK